MTSFTCCSLFLEGSIQALVSFLRITTRNIRISSSLHICSMQNLFLPRVCCSVKGVNMSCDWHESYGRFDQRIAGCCIYAGMFWQLSCFFSPWFISEHIQKPVLLVLFEKSSLVQSHYKDARLRNGCQRFYPKHCVFVFLLSFTSSVMGQCL